MTRSVLIIIPCIFLVALLISGCSKMDAEEEMIREDFPSIPEDMPVQNLGEMELISGTPKNVELDNGQSLVITADVQPDQTIQITLEYEATNQSVGSLMKKSYSEKSQFLLKPGMRCAPKLGDDLVIVFRPKIVDSEK